MLTKLYCFKFIVVLSFLFALNAAADEWPPIDEKEYKSSSGKYILKITPHKDWLNHPGHCNAVLSKVNGEQKQIWSRYLIKNIGPVQVFVTDSGRYVVTMDEWHKVGEFPVVIYGYNGELVEVHNIKSLGLEADFEHIRRTVPSYWWNEDALVFFDKNENYLFIRLHWGKIIIIDIRTGYLCDEKWMKLNQKETDELLDYAKKKTEEIALLKLNSEDPEQRRTGALVAGQLKIRKAIPRLREMLDDKSYYISQSGDEPSLIILYVRKAAKSSLEAMGEKVDNVVVELKEKGHLKKDPETGLDIVVFD